MSLQFTLVAQDDTQVISVFVPGQPPQVAMSDHPNFDRILDGALEGDESVIDLFDVAATVATKFTDLSERVSVANGRVYFDGDEIDNSLTKHILRCIDEGVSFLPFVRFLEKLMTNPLEHSRENLYRWLDAAEFTIAWDGDIVGYKGISRNASGGLESIHSGKAIVNGTVIEGRIPNAPGYVIEMPRSEVAHDPSIGCHYGLHVGTWDYAHSFGNGGVLEVRVNPRDVVSVPTDSSDQKMRCCRYQVRELLSEPYKSAVLDDDQDEYGWGEWDEGDDLDY